MNWVLPDAPNYKVGWAEQHSITKWKWYIYDWVQVGPKAQVSYKKSDLDAYGPHCGLLSHTAFSFLGCTFNLMANPYDQL